MQIQDPLKNVVWKKKTLRRTRPLALSKKKGKEKETRPWSHLKVANRRSEQSAEPAGRFIVLIGLELGNTMLSTEETFVQRCAHGEENTLGVSENRAKKTRLRDFVLDALVGKNGGIRQRERRGYAMNRRKAAIFRQRPSDAYQAAQDTCPGSPRKGIGAEMEGTGVRLATRRAVGAQIRKPKKTWLT